MGPSAASRARGPVTVLVTALIVLGEFGFLMTLFHLGDHVTVERTAQARVSGTLNTWQPGSDTGPVTKAVQALASTEVVGARRLQKSAQAWAVNPGDAAALRRLEAADSRVADRVRSNEHRSNVRVGAILAGLLVLVSLGWAVWFRQLVRRHRRLQQLVTQKVDLDASERRLLALVHNSVDLVAVLEPDSTASFVSPSATSVLGLRPEELTGRRFVDLLVPSQIPLFVGLLGGLREGEQTVTLQVQHPSGRDLLLEGTLNNLLGDSAVHGWVLTVRDVTDREALQEQLSYLGFHDALTGLANRQLFADRLAHALRSRDRATEPLAVLLIDLDDFKQVNDVDGHSAGDQCLITAAERISSVIRQGDTVARLGGDEFAILMENADVEVGRDIADRVLEALAEPVDDERTHWMRASIGIAAALPGQCDPQETLRNADVAMYWAKDRGKGRVAVYEAGLHAEALERLALRGELQRAVREEQLVLHYQPIVDLLTRRITGFEALVRWNHPTRGLLAPAHFIAVAEHSGLIVQLGSWVLRAACAAGASLQNEGSRPSMAVNIAAQQLARADFVDEVLEVLHSTGMPARRLVLEITESMVLDDMEGTVLTLNRLRERGVRVAIDDFGTGYSSLSYLSQLPVDILKIDKSFVDHVHEGATDTSLVETIISLSHSLRLVTVAEGVEHTDQADWLHHARCTLGQGFLWSRPVELGAARGLLLRGVPDDTPSASASR